MNIYIPSLGRADGRLIVAGPLADMDLQVMCRHRVYYVVPTEEVASYEQCSGWFHDYGVDVLGCDARGIAATRLWIGEHARASGSEQFLMLDDDIRFLVRRGDDVWNLRGPEVPETLELFWWIETLLHSGFAHVGVSAREGNNNMGVGKRHVLYSENQRTIRALAYSTEDFLSVEHGRVAVMEDFDVNLQLLERGRPSACIGYWAQGQKMTQAPGGCSTYRTHEVHEASARRLAELHPGVVSLRQKQNRTDADGFGSRTEVTIQWKQAYDRRRD